MKKSKTTKLIEGILKEEFSFAMEIRAYRTREGLSQDDLAKKLGVKKSYISNIENKRDRVSPIQAVIFAQKLKENPIYWLKTVLQDQVNELQSTTGQSIVVELKSFTKKKDSRKKVSSKKAG